MLFETVSEASKHHTGSLLCVIVLQGELLPPIHVTALW